MGPLVETFASDEGWMREADMLGETGSGRLEEGGSLRI